MRRLALLVPALLLAGCCCPSRPCRPCGSPCATPGPSSPCAAPTAQATPATPAAPKAPKAPETAAPAAGAPYNATCPVLLGNPVDPRYTTVWKGKVVGFCCPMCKAKFEKNPTKYEKNLP